MLILFAGYNGFSQFSSLSRCEGCTSENENIPKFSQGKLDFETSVISASWSNIVFWNGQNLILSGFHQGKPEQNILLDTPFKESVIQVTSGKVASFVVTSKGHVWQYNIESGEWKNLSHLFCAEVSDREPGRIVKICSGTTLNVAISDRGVLYCMPNILNYPGVIKDVVCGKEHGVVLTEDGSVLTWGGGSRGQLGSGELVSSETLYEVEALSGLRVVAISAGGWHTAAITDQGDLYTWGWNRHGQLGFPNLDDDKESGVSVMAVPRPVELDENMFVEQVSCGARHTVIKLKNGEVLGCGWNKWGQLGLEGVDSCTELTELPIPPEVTVRQVICGPWVTLLLCK